MSEPSVKYKIYPPAPPELQWKARFWIVGLKMAIKKHSEYGKEVTK